MGLFDRLFGKKKAQDSAPTPPPRSEKEDPTGEIVLGISAPDLQEGLLRNGVHYGETRETVKMKEKFSLDHEGVEKGNPWLIYRDGETQVIYNFDRNQSELDQIACIVNFNSKHALDVMALAYFQFLSGQYGEPVDPQMLSIKMMPVTRAIENCALQADLAGKMTKSEVKRERFDTWMVPVKDGKVKIDLLSLAIDFEVGGMYTLFLSYKLLPQNY